MTSCSLLLPVLFPRPPQPLSVCTWGRGCGGAGREGKWMHRFPFGVISVALREGARLQSLRRVRERMRWWEQQLAGWPGNRRNLCLSLSSSLLYVLSDFIYCVFLWNLEESAQTDLGWKGLVCRTEPLEMLWEGGGGSSWTEGAGFEL